MLQTCDKFFKNALQVVKSSNHHCSISGVSAKTYAKYANSVSCFSITLRYITRYNTLALVESPEIFLK